MENVGNSRNDRVFIVAEKSIYIYIPNATPFEYVIVVGRKLGG